MYHMASYWTHFYIGPLKENHLLEAKLKKVLWYDVATIGPTKFKERFTYIRLENVKHVQLYVSWSKMVLGPSDI